MKTIATSKLRTTLFRFSLLLSLITGFTLPSLAQDIVLTNPASPWTVPAGVTSIKVEVWGGGGGGGGTYSGFNTTRGAGGGGGGAYNTSTLTVIAGEIYLITIGTSGTAGAGSNNPSNGGTGGTTTLTGTGGTVSASGGVGGNAANASNGSGGAGGTGSYNGGTGGTSTGNGAGGGGGAGNNSAGGAGGNATTGAGGTGNPNNVPYIGGTGGAYITNNGTGGTGTAPGGGGGGGRASGWFTSNNGGSGASGQVVITYTPCVSPFITTQPDNQIANVGGSATFSITATGTGLTYQWRKGTNNITLATNASYTISPVAPGDAATNYNVVITGACGTVTSSDAALTLNAQPAASVTGKTNLTCFAVPDGTITIQASGGSGTGYEFSIDNGTTYVSGANPYTFTGLSANTPYKVRVKDSVGSESPAIP